MLLLVKIIIACWIPSSQGAGYDQACSSYVKGSDFFYFNAINVTEMSVAYENGKYDVECQDVVPPNITDQAPQITLLQNATEFCEYVTIILFETNITFGARNKTFLMWVVVNAKTQNLVNGEMGSSATTIVPYLQRTTTDPAERSGFKLKRRFFFVFCQPGFIPTDNFKGDDKGFDGRQMFKPKQFAQAHDLGVPYAGFYYTGRYLFPNETRNETDNGMMDGRKLCNETMMTRVCVCLPLNLLQGNEDGEGCFLSVDANTSTTAPPVAGSPDLPMGGGNNFQGQGGAVVTTASSLVGGVMDTVGGMMG